MKTIQNEIEIVSVHHRKAITTSIKVAAAFGKNNKSVYTIRQILEEGMSAGLHYKDIYQIARDRVFAFTKTLSGQSRITA